MVELGLKEQNTTYKLCKDLHNLLKYFTYRRQLRIAAVVFRFWQFRNLARRLDTASIHYEHVASMSSLSLLLLKPPYYPIMRKAVVQVIVHRQNDMLVDRNAHQPKRFNQPLGGHHVFGRRLHIAAGVVVAKYHSRAVEDNRWLKHIHRFYLGRPYRAGGNDVYPDGFIFDV